MSNKIALHTAGSIFTDWKTVSIRKSTEALCGAFQFVAVDRMDGKNLRLQPQQECIIKIAGTKIITGYIDSVVIEVSGDNHILTVSGRDKTSDLIDSSVNWPPPKLGKVKLAGLIKILIEPFGIKVKTEVDTGEIFNGFEINKGETVFEAMSRACNCRGILPITDADGNVLLTRPGTTKATDVIRYKENCTSFSATYDFTNRFYKYYLYTQSPNANSALQNVWGGSLDIFTTSKDEGVNRTARTLVVSAEGSRSKNDLIRRAKYEALHRAGESKIVRAVIPEWLQRNGTIWRPGLQVSCDLPPAYVNDELIISECNWISDDNGQVVNLELKPKESLDVLREAFIKPVKKGPFSGIFGTPDVDE